MSRIAPFHRTEEVKMDATGDKTVTVSIRMNPWTRWCPPARWFVAYIVFPLFVEAERQAQQDREREHPDALPGKRIRDPGGPKPPSGAHLIVGIVGVFIVEIVLLKIEGRL